MSTPTGGNPPPKRVFAGLVNVSRPLGYPATLVRTVAGVSPGTICATGTTTQALETDQIWAIIQDPSATPPTLPNPGGPPPRGSVQGTTPSTTSWRFIFAENREIPNAKCNAAGTVQNTLYVFGKFTDNSWAAAAPVTFLGKTSNTSQCGDYYTSVVLQAMQAQGGGTRGVDTAPQQYRVEAQGFISPLLTSFNGSWLLRLRPGAVSPWTWHNGGDGDLRPHIELSCDGPVASVWQLLFRHGAAVVRYTSSAAQWRALGANALSLVADAALAAAAVPPSLTAEPC